VLEKPIGTYCILGLNLTTAIIRNFFRISNTVTEFLTLFLLGKVKVDLTDFDIKLQEYLICTFFYKYLFLQRHLVNLFYLFHTVPALCSVLQLLQITRTWEHSRSTVVCSPAWCQSAFQSVPEPEFLNTLKCNSAESASTVFQYN
jgi:hypothetical protein